MILQQSAFEGILKSGIDFSQFAEHSPLVEDAIDISSFFFIIFMASVGRDVWF
jgi:hypothetical protein